MDEKVLEVCKRGHSRKCAVDACIMIKEHGFSLIGQMMIGLPSSDLEKEINTAKIISELCDGARVYPTVVLRETELCSMAKQGLYTPLKLEDAVMRTGEVLAIFDQAHKDAVISLLEHNNCRGFSYFEQMQGRGSKTGDPHYGSHAWPSMCSGIITIVDDKRVDNLLKELKALDEDSELLGLRAFVWNVEQSI